jgi:hypothetical protein
MKKKLPFVALQLLYKTTTKYYFSRAEMRHPCARDVTKPKPLMSSFGIPLFGSIMITQNNSSYEFT